MGISMDINDALFRHLNAAKISKELRESKEGKILKGFMIVTPQKFAPNFSGVFPRLKKNFFYFPKCFL